MKIEINLKIFCGSLDLTHSGNLILYVLIILKKHFVVMGIIFSTTFSHNAMKNIGVLYIRIPSRISVLMQMKTEYKYKLLISISILKS
jgi:hypothetical protein